MKNFLQIVLVKAVFIFAFSVFASADELDNMKKLYNEQLSKRWDLEEVNKDLSRQIDQWRERLYNSENVSRNLRKQLNASDEKNQELRSMIDALNKTLIEKEKEKETASPVSGGALSTEDIVAKVEKSVATIIGKKGSGSGFIIAPGIIVTNNHVVSFEKIEDLKIYFPSETKSAKGPFVCELIYENEYRDIAFLRIEHNNPSIEVVKNYKLRRGQKIICIGSPGSDIAEGGLVENSVAEGVIGGEISNHGLKSLQLSLAANHGNSGGPILDDTGKVIGILTFGEADPEIVAINYCIPPDDIASELEKAKNATAKKIDEVNKNHEYGILFNQAKSLFSLVEAIIAEASRMNEKFSDEEIKKLKQIHFEALSLLKKVIDNENSFQWRAYTLRALFVCDYRNGDKEMLHGAIGDVEQAIKLAPREADRKELRELKKQIQEML
ncbi:MAG: trypsin-like peptidase domain-containing protein [Planctomycetaceae bacterium]|jgi:S1-C subfamily serine protease|nr:trypsin-like peptidase domain-containing protein [Planctomycetaceae bacterium]